MVTTSTAEVVQVGAEHAGLLAEFYRNTWDSRATEHSVLTARAAAAANNAATPGAEVPTFLFLDRGRAVGHVTTIPIQLWDGGQERAAHWVKGLMVLPEYRNGPVGFLLLRHALDRIGPALAFVVQPEARKLFTALRFKDLGAVPNRIRLLRPGAVVRSLDLEAISIGAAEPVRRALEVGRRSQVIAGAADLVLRTAFRLRSLGADGLHGHTESTISDDAVDAVWARMRSGIGAAPARNSAALRLRYLQPNGAYGVVTVTEGGVCVGCAFVRAPAEAGDPRLRGLRIATLSDIVAESNRRDVLLGLLRAAETHARRLNADALLCSASHSALLPLLRRRAYLAFAGNVHLLVRDHDSALPSNLHDWWLLRGDSSADEVF